MIYLMYRASTQENPKRHLFHRWSRILVAGVQSGIENDLGVPQHGLVAGGDRDGLHEVLEVLVKVLWRHASRHGKGEICERSVARIVIENTHAQLKEMC